ncbi:hypothetical protein GobsT_52010 [Gemmata obscuriglobus]|uniref:DUF1598 domain-containing protein n=2 Tax=Gemmata obscuriglobus TaxID=114 RepID=A0A2Z3H1C0_9BACT|nr:hypothetical protein [Gemmata obscuriglobus]AWM36925.1 hypothetical protein C1280_07760 [Gemmata obscuriglobus]QEG30396.1 hypothetical protein GobsT_52010 [Gemmata obscuriglobus]VTS09720.1 Uncharacterized protein OS=Planctomyces maris DSM 8797 GN=PM8797T_09944 PE=4 SV=1 [Gemmata obscuriglobus UQM 2246]
MKQFVAIAATALLLSGIGWAARLSPSGEAAPPAAADEPKAKPPERPVKLGKISEVQPAARPAVEKERVERIKGLIADLAKLESADIGLSATLGGDDFAPVPGQSRFGSFLLTDHRVNQSEALRDLVALGPDALPYLLDALDDKTLTKITIKHDTPFGTMWYGGEMGVNPVNPVEAAVYKALTEPRKKESGAKRGIEGGTLKSYTVTVGDVCLVAIGQIVGRGYSAVRYQPTSNIVINSPTHDAELCANVRAIWKSKDPAKKLVDSLLADYATEGIFNGTSLDGWGVGNHFQCGAALRLLYYFPKESVPLIARRLGKLDVAGTPVLSDYMRQCVANGVRAEDFIKAVSWSKEPAIRSAVTDVFKRAEGVPVLRAALPGVEDKELIRGRLESFVKNLPAKESGPYGDGYHLLVELCERTPDTTKAVVQGYLRGAGVQRRLTVCLIFEKVKVPWGTEILAPLLDDNRDTDWGSYPVDPSENEPRLPIRICDAAADTLSHNHPELKFTLRGQHADLDKQIAVMREQLKRKK